jgi:hypothetical protein
MNESVCRNSRAGKLKREVTHAPTNDPQPIKRIDNSVSLLFPDSARAHTEPRLFHRKLLVMILSDLPGFHPAVSTRYKESKEARPSFPCFFFSSCTFQCKLQSLSSKGDNHISIAQTFNRDRLTNFHCGKLYATRAA